MIRILIVEDNAVVRTGLVALLNSQPDIVVTGNAAGGLEVLALLVAGLEPDILLTDMNMPGMDGLELCRRVMETYTIPVVFLTMHRQAVFLDKAIAAGAKGYLLKGEDFEDLFRGIRAVHSGETYISPGLPV